MMLTVDSIKETTKFGSPLSGKTNNKGFNSCWVRPAYWQMKRMDKHARIRDHMDGILEAKGFYRMHVGKGPDSIFRSVSAALFGTQKMKDVVEDDLNNFRRSERGLKIFLNSDLSHREAVALSNFYNLVIFVVSNSDGVLESLQISPDAKRGPDFSDLREFKRKQVMLCYTEPSQYDLVYLSSKIEAAGIVQSILYQILYEDVFKQERSYEAALMMMSDIPDKPTLFNGNFTGSPMEALNANLIPFPYKVAKVMDPSSYRNIEYDSWFNDFKLLPNGDLPKNTPCMVENQGCLSTVGLVQGPTKDRGLIEVFLPYEGLSVFVPRNSIYPIGSRFDEFKNSSKSPLGKKKRSKRPHILNFNSESFDFSNSICRPEEAQIERTEDPLPESTWLGSFDFSVPPPSIFPNQQPQIIGSGFTRLSYETSQSFFFNQTQQCHSPLILTQPPVCCHSPFFSAPPSPTILNPHQLLLQTAPLTPIIAVPMPTSPLFQPNQPTFCFIPLASQYWDGSIPPPGTPLPTPGFTGPVFRFDFPGDILQGAPASPTGSLPIQNV